MPQGTIPSPNSMSSASAQFATSSSMGIYEVNHQNRIWGNSFKGDSCPNTGASAIVEADAKLDNRLEDIPSEALGPSKRYDQEANKPANKVLRRLVQNREAARKSRLRKKAHVQQLETSRIKLTQVEQELERARQQAVYVGGHAGDSSLGLSGAINSGVAVFEMEYGHLVEKQNLQINELRSALQAHVSDIELRMLVESGMSHYDELFRIKAIAAKSDVFYLMSGMWKTAAERFFLWIGGFRPSELLKVLHPQLEPLTEQQLVAVYNLQQSSQQAEDALSQGMDKLQQTLSESLTSDPLGSSGMANYKGQMASAMGKLEALVSFVTQTLLSISIELGILDCMEKHRTQNSIELSNDDSDEQKDSSRHSDELHNELHPCRPPSTADPAANVQNSYNQASSKRPACLGGLLPAPSRPQLPVGCSASRTSLNCNLMQQWIQEITLLGKCTMHIDI